MTNFLLFSDLHAQESSCHKLVAASEKADILIGAGDLGNLRHGDELEAAIAILQTITKPTILVPGNSESFDELKDACKNWPSAIILHGSGCEVQGHQFWGIGGGIPMTPFGDWSYDFSEDEAEAMLADCPMGAILVSHSPPKGILDESSRGQSLGSSAIRRCLEEKQPPLLACGHIHESSGTELQFKNSKIINAGPNGIFVRI